MAWVALLVAGILEVVWATTMKRSDGFTRLWPSVATILAGVASFSLLAWSMRVLPLGAAYAIWTGIGAIGAFLVGVLLLGEAASGQRIAAATMILGGLILMKISTPG